MEVYDNILDIIGNTPMVRLNRVARDVKPTVYAKLEMFNPGNSVKDRIGIRMIRDAEEKGLLKKGGTIVEPTSGNTGTGLAVAAAITGYKCIFVMPDKISEEKRALLRAYGAEVVITPTALPRESPESYYNVADRLTREIAGAFQPNQYFNLTNPRTHFETTGPEIWRQLDGKVDVFVAGVGTGGTISGVGNYLKSQNPKVIVVGADPEGSIFTQDRARPYKVEGIGEDFMPGAFDSNVVDEWVTVSDRDSFELARRLTREEGILAGGSCGTALHAALTVAAKMDASKNIVVLLPDSGRSYLSKIYNDDWMRENGFLDRLPIHARARDLVTSRGAEMPSLVTVPADHTVREAIDLLHRYGISQLPVTRSSLGGNGNGHFTDVQLMIGSIQERNLLEKVFRNPALVDAKVESVMDPPFPLVDVAEEVERIVPALLANNSAVLVEEGGAPVGLVTRSDLLEFVASGRR